MLLCADRSVDICRGRDRMVEGVRGVAGEPLRPHRMCFSCDRDAK